MFGRNVDTNTSFSIKLRADLDDFEHPCFGVTFQGGFQLFAEVLNACQADVDEIEKRLGMDGAAVRFVEDADFALGVEDQCESGLGQGLFQQCWIEECHGGRGGGGSIGGG